ncbi:hypothetical protein GCM10011419_16300 [Vogesella fluminis]|uniref:Uncharacterized protein n=1 Tax=Vogesella fluminis TaxID=1069161 RepID=A0ABQ3H8Y4_9NEIS|nr:hypothetical protein GCM10011419_16300 [Vogesella fluminis]
MGCRDDGDAIGRDLQLLAIKQAVIAVVNVQSLNLVGKIWHWLDSLGNWRIGGWGRYCMQWPCGLAASVLVAAWLDACRQYFNHIPNENHYQDVTNYIVSVDGRGVVAGAVVAAPRAMLRQAGDRGWCELRSEGAGTVR